MPSSWWEALKWLGGQQPENPIVSGHDFLKILCKDEQFSVFNAFDPAPPPAQVRLHGGSLFGERALLKNEPRAASVTAVTEAILGG